LGRQFILELSGSHFLPTGTVQSTRRPNFSGLDRMARINANKIAKKKKFFKMIFGEKKFSNNDLVSRPNSDEPRVFICQR
jgi:hypothetical protein